MHLQQRPKIHEVKLKESEGETEFNNKNGKHQYLILDTGQSYAAD